MSREKNRKSENGCDEEGMSEINIDREEDRKIENERKRRIEKFDYVK